MAAASGVKLGIKAVVYRNTGSYGSPTWTALPLAKDVTVTPPWDLTDASSRSHRVKLYAKTMMDLGVTISLRKDDADAGAVAMLAGAMGDTAIDFLVLDGPLTTEGSTGFRSHMLVNLTSEDQGSGAAIYDGYELKPAYSSAGDPKYVTIGAASAITATAVGS